MSITLKPCPFCGYDEPTFERLGTPRQSCIVVCGNCGCRHESSDEGANNGRSWNSRIGPTPVTTPLPNAGAGALSAAPSVPGPRREPGWNGAMLGEPAASSDAHIDGEAKA